MSKKLISCSATIIAELDISNGAPTIQDLKRGKYTLEVSEPLDRSLTLIIRQNEN